MIKIGRWNRLKALRSTPPGVFLGDGQEEVLLPHKWVPRGLDQNDEIEVFIYRDSEQRMIATTLKPYIEVGEFALLRVRETSSVGAFLDWGLEKDLFVPYREQANSMIEGRGYLVYLYLDPKSNRLVASSRLYTFINNNDLTVDVGDKVDIIIADPIDIGYKVIVNGAHWGMVYRNEAYQELRLGDRMEAYVKAIRDDNKIDLSLQRIGYDNVGTQADELMKQLRLAGGRLELGDKSDAEVIKQQLKMSKKTFKKAAGLLYKQGKVIIEPKAVYFVPPKSSEKAE